MKNRHFSVRSFTSKAARTSPPPSGSSKFIDHLLSLLVDLHRLRVEKMTSKDIDLVYSALEKGIIFLSFFFFMIFLFTGDYAKAEKLCEKPEISKFTLVQALLAYTYASQRKYEKALDLGRKLLKLEPSDEAVVNALGCAFKLCHSDADFATCYENGIKLNVATPPHFHSELFFCYLRLNDVKRMQQVAQRAYKLTDDVEYLEWMATCILLQSDLPKPMLAVAEKMLLKVFNEIRPKNPPGTEELLLLVTTLLRENKLTESIPILEQLISRPLPSPLNDEDHFKENSNLVVMQKHQELFLLLDVNRVSGNTDNVLNFSYAILDELPDQWNVFELLHSIAFQKDGSVLLPKGSLCKSFSGLHCLEECEKSEDANCSYGPSQYQEYLLALVQKHPRLRGPSLAYLYFILESLLQADSNLIQISELAAPGELMDLLLWINSHTSRGVLIRMV